MKLLKIFHIVLIVLIFMVCDNSPSGKYTTGNINENPKDFPLNPQLDHPISNSSVIDDILNIKSDNHITITSENEKKLNSQIKMELDVSSGKWFKTPKKKLNFITEKEYLSQKNRINELKNQVTHAKANMNPENQDEIQTKINDLKKQMLNIYKAIGCSNRQSGIHTYWSEQDLILNVKNVKKPGWYVLSIIVKNSGKLPDFYKLFNFSVRDDINDKTIGGLFIEASDTKYKRGKITLYLNSGENKFNLLWLNDAYKKDNYDVNIQIKNISLSQSTKDIKSQGLTKKVHQYSRIKGKFFWDKDSVWTYVPGQTLSFNYPNLKPGIYEITISAKNYGNLGLPSGYEHFKIRVDSDGLSKEILVPAVSQKYSNGKIKMDLTGSDTIVSLTWLNDEYLEGKHDTNIQMKNIKLTYIEKSKRSPISAFLLGTTTGNRMIIITLFFIIISITSMFSILNKKRSII